MTPEKKAKQNAKRSQRHEANVLGKAIRAAQRREEMIELGKTVIVSEKDGVKNYAFPPKRKEPPSPPRLSWLNGKTFRHSAARKNSPGLKDEHAAAILENASRSLAVEIDKALAPPPPTPELPMVSPVEGIA